MDPSSAITVQPQVRAYARSQGERGQRWLDELPGLVEDLCREWTLTRYEALSGGSRSYVCRVGTATGERGVLKVALPEAILETQVGTLLAANGQGYVQVLAHDLGRGALLLESLGPSAEELIPGVPELLSVTARTLRRAWEVPYGPEATPSESEHKASTLAALVRECAAKHAGLASVAVIEQALRYAHERLQARDEGRQVWVHGDAHAGNLLQVERLRPGADSGYVFVDPEGFVCEPEYDLGVALRGWNTQLLACADPQAEVRGWCEQLARETGTSAEAIRQWAYLERVSTGLYLARHGLAELGTPFLEVAERLLESSGA